MTTLQAFAIRHKPTGNFLPAHGKGVGGVRGFSFDNPLPDGGKYGPRLFGRFLSAKVALSSWLQGEFQSKHDQSLDGESEISIEVKSRPDRVKADMEIVTFTLTEQK